MAYYTEEQRTGQGEEGHGGVTRVMRGCFIAVMAAAVIGVLALIAVVGFMIAGTAIGLASAPRRVDPVGLREVYLSGPVDAPKIAVISVEGLLHGNATVAGRMSPVTLLSAQLDRAQLDPDVKGVLLLVDSPGGSVTGSDILHERIRELREERDPKPVVASILNMGTSGAYYSICGADRIMAHPTSLTGSIGVMMPLYNFTELMEKIGVREESILSGEFKDLASPFSEPTDEEQRERRRELLENIVSSMHGQFVDTVAAGRNLEPEAVSEVADGRILTAAQALDAGLIDAIGYERDAVDALGEMMDVPEPRLVMYRREVSLGALLTALVSARGLSLEALLPFLDEEQGMRLRPMYLPKEGR